MANVTLVNRTKRPPRMLVLNLTRQVAPVQVENRTTEESRDGTRRKRVSTKLVPAAVRIPARGEAEVDEVCLGCPDVAAAIARREILVRRPAKPAPVTEPVTEKVADEESGNDEGRARSRRRTGS